MRLDFRETQKGFVALITALVVSAVVLVIGVGLGLGSINEMKMALQKSQSSEAYYLANLCAEEALMKLKEDSAYLGNENINMENGNCTILPIEGNWIVKVLATASNQTKKMKLIISQINPEIIIDSWEEVADF